MRRVFLAAIASCLFGSGASASDAEVARQFGLLGKWAVDCAAPPDVANPHAAFAVTAGNEVEWTLTMAPAINGTFQLRNLSIVAPDRLQFRQDDLTVTMRMTNGKLRSWRSVENDGQVLIADGILAANRKPAPTFTLCGK